MAQNMKVTPIAPGVFPAAGHPEEFTIVGKGVPVKDAVEKVTGSLTFAVDFAVQDMAYGKVLRSPHAHARITSIDVSKAEALPGVLGVVTHHDAPAGIWENAWFNYRGRILDDTVRFVGDDVAAIAAETQEIAEAALDLIDVEYELLPAVFDPDEAREVGAPEVHPEGNERPAYIVEWGDVDTGEAEADYVVDADVRFESQQMACIGRNACIAFWKDEKLTVWVSSQTPSEVRDGLHESFEIPLSKIRVIALPVGSSFGLWWSGNFIMLTALLAQKARRPVKIELTNEECFSVVKRRHKEHTRGRAGCTKDGALTFTQFDHVIDNGGYGFKDDVGFFCVDMWGRARHGHWAIHGVNTNLCTAGCMRAVGDMTLGSVIERLADQLAEKVGMDPVDFRLKNQITAGDELRMQHSRMNMKATLEEYIESIPAEVRHHWPEMFHLSSGGTKDILTRGSDAFRWKERWRGWGVPTAVDGPLRRGVGVGTGCHVCGVEFEGATSAVVRINPDGSAQVAVNCGRQGQGSETTLSQIAAETLGIPFELIEIETGDTDSGPWSHGSLASNTVYRIGWAVWAASLDARRQLLEIASREFFDGADLSDLAVAAGFVRRVDGNGPSVAIEEMLNELRSDSLGQTSSITGRPAMPMPPAVAFARHFAAHFVDVQVDVETGVVRLVDYLACQDSGTIVNPQVMKNQAIGGALCGSGFALHEHLVFDEDDGRVLNPGFLDYKVLRASDFPTSGEVLFGNSYDPVGPFGARGGGEAPAIPPGPAITQAVYNATGVWIDMPLTPERVLSALGRTA
jgi:xanthine dehydrogenase molybdenum-binding subunit